MTRIPNPYLHKTLCLNVFLIVALSACTLKSEVTPIHPNPIDKVIIYGTLPADQGLDLRMTARFESKSSLCGRFVDISHVYQLSKTIDIEVQKSDNSYEAHFFRDAIAKGKCDWTFIYASTKVLDKSGNVAWITFYNATSKDLKKSYLKSVLHEEGNHLFKVSCHGVPEENVKSGGSASGLGSLKCSKGGIFLIPGIQKYHVDYDYSAS